MSRLFPRLSWSFRSAALVLLLFGLGHAYAQKDPLPSWNNGPAKQAILKFVKDTTDKGSPGYVAPEDRIATFDQDGTVWAEHPLYTQAMFALDRMHEMAPRHPEWRGRYLYMYTTISGNSVIRSDEAKASP